MAIAIPFPLPSTGYALNSKVRVNLDFIVAQFNEFNTGAATWDTVAVGSANSILGAIVLYNSTNAYSVTLKPNTDGTGNINLTLPATLPASTGVMTITSAGVIGASSTPTVTSLTTDSVVLPNGSSFDTTIKGHPSTGTDFDFYLPQTNGDSGQYLKSDGTYCVWGDSPVESGLIAYLPIYSGAAIGGSTSTLKDYTNFDGQMLRLAIADHALTTTRTYTIPDAGADASFIMSGSAGAFSSVSVDTEFVGYTLRLRGASSGNLTVQAAATTTNHTLTFPANNASGILTNNGSGTLSWAATAPGAATPALDNLAAVAINTSLISDTDATDDLGSSSAAWNNLYVKNIFAGRSGSVGEILIYPTTAAKGKISISATDSADDYTLYLTNASLAASRIYTFPDAGANADVVMTAGNQTIGGTKTFSTAPVTPLTASRAVVTGGSSELAASSVTSTELGYVSGVTSAIQTQLNGKVGTSGNETIAGDKTFSGGTLAHSAAPVGGVLTTNTVNSDNTNTGSHARVLVSTGGSSSGDPYINFLVSGVTNWCFGMDNSDSDKLVISEWPSLGSNNRLEIRGGGTICMNAYGAGTATFDANGVISSVSDIRLKDVEGKFTKGLSAILGIDPINYRWKDDGSGRDTANVYTGFSAQNVKKSLPEATFQNKDGLYSFQDRVIIAALVNAVKELSARVVELEKKNGI